MLMAVVELRRNVNQVELEMFSQRASPLVSRLLIEESLPLCVVSLELNRRQPPKVQAKALILKTRKRHQQDPSMGSLLSPLPLHTYSCSRANREAPITHSP